MTPLAAWVAVALASELSIEDLERSAAAAATVIASCRANLAECDREALADAMYGRALLVWLRDFLADAEAAAIVREVDPDRFDRLPDEVRAGAAEDAPSWFRPQVKPGTEPIPVVDWNLAAHLLTPRETRALLRAQPELREPGRFLEGVGVLPGNQRMRVALRSPQGRTAGFTGTTGAPPEQFLFSGRAERDGDLWKLELDGLGYEWGVDYAYEGPSDVVRVRGLATRRRSWIVEFQLAEGWISEEDSANWASYMDPPLVVSLWPAPGAVDVDADLELRVTFDRPMDPTSVLDENGNIALPMVFQSGLGEIDSTPRWEDGDRTLLIPVRLEPGSRYDIRMLIGNPALKGLEDAPVEPFRFTFETGSR